MTMRLSCVACISSVLFALLPVAIGQNAPSIKTAAPGSVPKLPIPSGHYGVGRAGFDWTDTNVEIYWTQNTRAN